MSEYSDWIDYSDQCEQGEEGKESEYIDHSIQSLYRIYSIFSNKGIPYAYGASIAKRAYDSVSDIEWKMGAQKGYFRCFR